MTNDGLGSRVKEAREEAKVSCRELDRLAGLGEGHTNMIERGCRRFPSGETVQALAKALHTTVEWLLDGTGPRRRPAKGVARAPSGGAQKTRRTGT